MINVEKSADGSMATVSGDKTEVMMFFQIWQNRLWPEWIDASPDNVGAIRQHRRAIASIRDTGVIVLHDASHPFEEAVKYAIGQCKRFGIEVKA